MQEADQGLTNSNKAFIAVPTRNINLVPTDIRGLTFSRTPQQVQQHCLRCDAPAWPLCSARPACLAPIHLRTP